MKRTRGATSLVGLAAIVFTIALAAPALASAPRSGILDEKKECSEYTGQPGSFCTITSSNVRAIPAGSRVVYASAPGAGVLDSDLVVQTRGANLAFGHVVLDLATGFGTVTLSGGTGQFKMFSASVAVSPLGGADFGWVGPYSY
jgi:hypothetical protein